MQGLDPVPERDDPTARLLDPSGSDSENDFDEDANQSEFFSNAAFEASEEVPEATLSEVVVLLQRMSHRIDSLERAKDQQQPQDPRARPRASPVTDPVGDQPNAPGPSSRRQSDPGPSYVNHGSLRQRIATGYEAQAPSPLAPLRPHMYMFNDEISRSLTGTRFSAKLTEYRFTCVNGFFISCANQALLELVETLDSIPVEVVRARLSKIYNTHSAIESLLRDRKTFLATQNDPSATQAMRAFADTILRNRFEADFAAYGASADSVETYDVFTEQVARSRLWATAKAEAQRELEAGRQRSFPPSDKPTPAPNPNASRGQQGKGKGKDKEKAKGADSEKTDT